MASKGTALVAGAGGAIGVALCRRLRAAGYYVVGAGRSQARLAHELAGAAHELREVELSSESSVQQALGGLGAVDVLVYNAGRIDLAPIAETTPEMFLASWQTNALGAFHCARLLAPGLMGRGHGTLVFLGATTSLRGGARSHAFASSKHALRGLVASLAKELGPRGVHVAHLVIDAKVWGERTRQRFPGTRQEDCLAPEQVVDAVCALIAQPPAAWTFELELLP